MTPNRKGFKVPLLTTFFQVAAWLSFPVGAFFLIESFRVDASDWSRYFFSGLGGIASGVFMLGMAEMTELIAKIELNTRRDAVTEAEK